MNKDYIEPETNNVVGLQFSIMSPEEIRKRSVVEVTKHDTYDKDNPIIKGLFDIRMGTTEMDKICGTCGQSNINCPGHFGHIELARPVYHYQFVHTLQKVLKCTCIQCSKLLINKESAKVKDLMKKPNKSRWNEIYNLSQKITRCGQETEDGCGAKQPDKIKVDGMDGIYAVWNKLEVEDASMKTQHLTIETVRGILERITDEDVNILGLSDLWCRPEWMICSVFPIPPPAVRPSVKQDDSQRMDDDLTHKLSDIIHNPLFIHENMSSSDALKELRKYRLSMAIIVGSTGETVGLVTIEDLIEEIFGEFEDIFDKESKKIIKLSDNSFIIDGRIQIKFKIFLPKGNYETIGGYIIEKLGKIPEKGNTLNSEFYKIRVLKASSIQVQRIQIIKKKNF